MLLLLLLLLGTGDVRVAGGLLVFATGDGSFVRSRRGRGGRLVALWLLLLWWLAPVPYVVGLVNVPSRVLKTPNSLAMLTSFVWWWWWWGLLLVADR